MACAARIVFVTVPRGAKAARFARQIVALRLAACVNILPGVSHYRWKGKICCDAESLMMIKTTSASVPRLRKWIAQNHPYEVPEFLVLNVASGSPGYLAWIGEGVR